MQVCILYFDHTKRHHIIAAYIRGSQHDTKSELIKYLARSVPSVDVVPPLP